MNMIHTSRIKIIYTTRQDKLTLFILFIIILYYLNLN